MYNCLRFKLLAHWTQVCAAVGLCQSAAGNAANASVATAAAARKLLAGAAAGAGAGALGDPSPFCQFCTVAISYIKARCISGGLPVPCLGPGRASAMWTLPFRLRPSRRVTSPGSSA